MLTTAKKNIKINFEFISIGLNGKVFVLMFLNYA